MTKKNTFKRVMALMLVLVCVMSSVSVVGVSAASQTTRHLRIHPYQNHDAYRTINYTFTKGNIRVKCVDSKIVKKYNYSNNYDGNYVLCWLCRSDGKLVDSAIIDPKGYTPGAPRNFTTFNIPKTGKYYFCFWSLSGYEEILYMQWYNL